MAVASGLTIRKGEGPTFRLAPWVARRLVPPWPRLPAGR